MTNYEAWKTISVYNAETTTAMEVEGIGVVIKVTTETAVGLTFVPFATIIDVLDSEGNLTGHRIAMREVMEDIYE